MDKREFTLVEHLSELRKRLFIITIVVIISSFVSYFFGTRVIDEVLKPAGKFEFVYLAPAELFMAYVKISIVMGVTVSSPIILYQLWAFIKPGLNKHERRYMIFSLFSGVCFFILGITFAYKVLLPISIEFFAKMKVEGIKPMISFGNYLGFMSSMMLSCGIVFEMPMMVLLLTRFRLIKTETLTKNRKIIIFLIFILAAILTPPDVISQLLLSGPIILLFELSVIISKVVSRRIGKMDGELVAGS